MIALVRVSGICGSTARSTPFSTCAQDGQIKLGRWRPKSSLGMGGDTPVRPPMTAPTTMAIKATGARRKRISTSIPAHTPIPSQMVWPMRRTPRAASDSPRPS